MMWVMRSMASHGPEDYQITIAPLYLYEVKAQGTIQNIGVGVVWCLVGRAQITHMNRSGGVQRLPISFIIIIVHILDRVRSEHFRNHLRVALIGDKLRLIRDSCNNISEENFFYGGWWPTKKNESAKEGMDGISKNRMVSFRIDRKKIGTDWNDGIRGFGFG